MYEYMYDIVVDDSLKSLVGYVGEVVKYRFYDIMIKAEDEVSSSGGKLQ